MDFSEAIVKMNDSVVVALESLLTNAISQSQDDTNRTKIAKQNLCGLPEKTVAGCSANEEDLNIITSIMCRYLNDEVLNNADRIQLYTVDNSANNCCLLLTTLLTTQSTLLTFKKFLQNFMTLFQATGYICQVHNCLQI